MVRFEVSYLCLCVCLSHHWWTGKVLFHGAGQVQKSRSGVAQAMKLVFVLRPKKQNSQKYVNFDHCNLIFRLSVPWSCQNVLSPLTMVASAFDSKDRAGQGTLLRISADWNRLLQQRKPWFAFPNYSTFVNIITIIVQCSHIVPLSWGILNRKDLSVWPLILPRHCPAVSHHVSLSLSLSIWSILRQVKPLMGYHDFS